MRLIEANNLSKRFDDLMVLDDVSFNVDSGESISIVGPSGVGKSTILRIIGGLEKQDSGSVSINAKKIGMVFQYSALLNSYTVGENIALALYSKKLNSDEVRKIVLDKLQIVGLEKYIDSYPDQLSGGQRKRVGFARAVANDPEVILYDEPTAGLDPVLSTLIENYINKLSKDYKVASVVVTHHMSTIRRTADRVLLLFGGKFVWKGTPEEFIKSDNPYVVQFVNAEVEGPMLEEILRE